jgi:hypothetical protein
VSVEVVYQAARFIEKGVGNIGPGAFAAMGILAVLLRARALELAGLSTYRWSMPSSQFANVSLTGTVSLGLSRMPKATSIPSLRLSALSGAKDGFVSIAAPD